MHSWQLSPQADALMQTAMSLHQAGRLGEAAQAYQAVLAQDSRHAEAMHLLGVVHLQSGLVPRAIELIRAATELRPDSPDILGNLATAYSYLGQFAEALAIYDRVLLLVPRDYNALFGRSAMLLYLGRREEALDACDKALALNPKAIPALFHRGNILATLGRSEEAVKAMDAVLALAPGNVEALNNRGNALSAMTCYQEAIASYDQALAIKPDYLDALNNRANALKALERFEEALAGYDAVLKADPRHVDALSNYGSALIELRRPIEALRYLDDALALAPRNVGALNSRSVALLQLGRNDEAFACARASLAIDPDNYEASYLYLLNGELAEGWRLYERRPNAHRLRRRAYSQPEWKGERVAGTLLLTGEQGLGDQVLYSGLIAELESKADRLVVEVEPRLVELFRRSFPRTEIVAMGDDLYAGEIAAQTMIASTAKFLRPDWNSFKRHPEKFLHAEEKRVADFRARLEGALNIGISWHSKKAATGKIKSAQLIDFTSLLDLEGVRLVDLQYGDTAEERSAFSASTRHAVTHFDDLDLTNDIDGLAALVSACDAVVTVSNTTAHIAGALGKRTWVMPPFGYARIWYWVDHGEGNPWYPSVTVRQQRPDKDWSDLISSIRDEVVLFAAAK